MLDGSRAVSAFSTDGNLAMSPCKKVGPAQVSMSISCLTQQPRNSSNHRDSHTAKAPVVRQVEGARSLKAKAAFALQKYFACNVYTTSDAVNARVQSESRAGMWRTIHASSAARCDC